MASTSITSLHIVDRFNKGTNASVHSVLLTAGNFAAQATLRAAFVAALVDLSAGTLREETVIAAKTGFTDPIPTDENAVKGNRFLCRATDVNGNAVTMHIPVALLSAIPAGQDVDLTAGDGLAFKTSWDAFVKSNDGEDTVLQQVTYLDK